jgi:hypothetical protein
LWRFPSNATVTSAREAAAAGAGPFEDCPQPVTNIKADAEASIARVSIMVETAARGLQECRQVPRSRSSCRYGIATV